MASIQATLIWKRLLLEGYKFVTSDRIKDLAREFGKNEDRSLRYLQEHGYTLRVLRGVFYVMSPEEIEQGYHKYSIYEMVSEALSVKGVKNWYFGLESALKMNRMTHEFFTVECVITDHGCAIFHSDKERTVLDLSYRAYLERGGLERTIAPIVEYGDRLDKDKAAGYLTSYPPKFREMIAVGQVL